MLPTQLDHASVNAVLSGGKIVLRIIVAVRSVGWLQKVRQRVRVAQREPPDCVRVARCKSQILTKNDSNKIEKILAIYLAARPLMPNVAARLLFGAVSGA